MIKGKYFTSFTYKQKSKNVKTFYGKYFISKQKSVNFITCRSNRLWVVNTFCLLTFTLTQLFFSITHNRLLHILWN